MSQALKKQSVGFPSPRRSRVIVISTIGVLVLLIVILWGSLVWSLSAGTQDTGQTSTISTPGNETGISDEHRAQSQAIDWQYMTALLRQQYNIMWSMLHPQVQAMWPSEAAFAHFWQARFQDYTLKGFVLGKAHALLHWVNPETMVSYHQVVLIPTSLQLEPKPSLQQQAGVPPEDLHPEQVFQNLPFIIQQVTSQNGQQSRWLVLDGGPADLEAPILPPVSPVNNTVKVPILMYHHIYDVPPKNLLDLSLTVTPTHFTQQLDYLKSQGYHTITFNQLFDALYYGGPLPAHPIILTLDDGYNDAYHFAFPILQAHGFSGMFYIITGVVGQKGYVSWPEIREMLAAGMQIGSHTIHHVDMGQALLYSPDQAQRELQVSQATLQRNLGVVIQQFCYPAGEPFRHGSLALQQRIVVLLAADGYVGATTDPGRTGVDQSSEAPFVLLRIRVDGRESFGKFTASIP